MTVTEKTKDVLDKIDWNSVDLSLERAGEKIILPNVPTDMSIDAGIAQLQKIKKAEETVYAVAETIPVHFFDGVVAFAKALKHKYGFSQAVPTPGFYGSKPPMFIHVKTGPDQKDFVQVPFGQFQIPGVEGSLQTGYAMSRGIPCFQLSGNVKAKEKKIVMELVALTLKFSREASIYRGRSITLERDESGGIDFDEPLVFFDPFIGTEVPIFNREIEELIEVTIHAPIRKMEACRKNKIPLKRGILLEGPYGCGKTLTARTAARVANENGWTFINVTAATSLKYALDFAKMYQPALVFAEDIDRIAGNRNEGANDLLNQIDGVVGKNDAIITVLTTNFAEQIDKGFLRPGRLDAVISVREPDPDTVQRLVRFYAGPLLDEAADLEKVGEILKGQIPASIREAVERSKLSMLAHDRDKITGDDIYTAAMSMNNHRDLMARASEGRREPESISSAIQTIVHAEVKKLAKAIGRDI